MATNTPVPVSRFKTPSRGVFPETNWSLIARYQKDQVSRSDEKRTATELCEAYWRPVYTYVRWKGMDPEDAQDVTQEIFSSLFATGRLETVSAEKGRLRSFLKAVAKHHVAEFVRHRSRQKRGGDQTRLPFDISDIEAATDFEGAVPEPEASFDRDWAIDLMDRAERQLRNYYDVKGRVNWFDALFPLLTSDSTKVKYADLAEVLETNEGSVKVGAYRMRQRYRKFLRAEIAKTVETVDEIESELLALRVALSRE